MCQGGISKVKKETRAQEVILPVFVRAATLGYLWGKEKSRLLALLATTTAKQNRIVSNKAVILHLYFNILSNMWKHLTINL